MFFAPAKRITSRSGLDAAVSPHLARHYFPASSIPFGHPFLCGASFLAVFYFLLISGLNTLTNNYAPSFFTHVVFSVSPPALSFKFCPTTRCGSVSRAFFLSLIFS